MDELVKELHEFFKAKDLEPTIIADDGRIRISGYDSTYYGSDYDHLTKSIVINGVYYVIDYNIFNKFESMDISLNRYKRLWNEKQVELGELEEKHNRLRCKFSELIYSIQEDVSKVIDGYKP